MLDKRGAWYSYNGENIAQGKTKLREYLLTNQEIYNKIFEQVMEK
ncbi:hypothetical protein [Mycoplasmopsis felis]